jgi:hypothetical protein
VPSATTLKLSPFFSSLIWQQCHWVFGLLWDSQISFLRIVGVVEIHGAGGGSHCSFTGIQRESYVNSKMAVKNHWEQTCKTQLKFSKLSVCSLLPLSPSHTHFLSPCVSFCHEHTVSFSVTHPLSVFLFLSVSVCLCHTFPQSLSVSVSVTYIYTHRVCVSVSHTPSLCVSVSLSLSLSLSPSEPLSHCLSSFCGPVEAALLPSLLMFQKHPSGPLSCSAPSISWWASTRTPVPCALRTGVGGKDWHLFSCPSPPTRPLLRESHLSLGSLKPISRLPLWVVSVAPSPASLAVGSMLWTELVFLPVLFLHCPWHMEGQEMFAQINESVPPLSREIL